MILHFWRLRSFCPWSSAFLIGHPQTQTPDRPLIYGLIMVLGLSARGLIVFPPPIFRGVGPLSLLREKKAPTGARPICRSTPVGFQQLPSPSLRRSRRIAFCNAQSSNAPSPPPPRGVSFCLRQLADPFPAPPKAPPLFADERHHPLRSRSFLLLYFPPPFSLVTDNEEGSLHLSFTLRETRWHPFRHPPFRPHSSAFRALPVFR